MEGYKNIFQQVIDLLEDVIAHNCVNDIAKRTIIGRINSHGSLIYLKDELFRSDIVTKEIYWRNDLTGEVAPINAIDVLINERFAKPSTKKVQLVTPYHPYHSYVLVGNIDKTDYKSMVAFIVKVFSLFPFINFPGYQYDGEEYNIMALEVAFNYIHSISNGFDPLKDKETFNQMIEFIMDELDISGSYMRDKFESDEEYLDYLYSFLVHERDENHLYDSDILNDEFFIYGAYKRLIALHVKRSSVKGAKDPSKFISSIYNIPTRDSSEEDEDYKDDGEEGEEDEGNDELVCMYPALYRMLTENGDRLIRPLDDIAKNMKEPIDVPAFINNGIEFARYGTATHNESAYIVDSYNKFSDFFKDLKAKVRSGGLSGNDTKFMIAAINVAILFKEISGCIDDINKNMYSYNGIIDFIMNAIVVTELLSGDHMDHVETLQTIGYLFQDYSRKKANEPPITLSNSMRMTISKGIGYITHALAIGCGVTLTDDIRKDLHGKYREVRISSLPTEVKQELLYIIYSSICRDPKLYVTEYTKFLALIAAIWLEGLGNVDPYFKSKYNLKEPVTTQMTSKEILDGASKTALAAIEHLDKHGFNPEIIFGENDPHFAEYDYSYMEKTIREVLESATNDASGNLSASAAMVIEDIIRAQPKFSTSAEEGIDESAFDDIFDNFSREEDEDDEEDS